MMALFTMGITSQTFLARTRTNVFKGVAVLVHGTQKQSCFGLLGDHENAATAALGWCLEKSPTLARVLADHLGIEHPSDEIDVASQVHGKDKGFTDLEVIFGPSSLVIFEAKVGWQLPSQEQLEKYQGRLGGNASSMLVTISAASQRWAAQHQHRLKDVRQTHLTWGELAELGKEAYRRTNSPIEKLWTTELIEHLRSYGMDSDIFNAKAFVVPLAATKICDGSELTWTDIVLKQGRYFHPYEKGWPKVAPAYLGFRYRAAFRSAHFVDEWEVVDRLSDVDPRWTVGEGPHIVYRLAPPMTPREPLPVDRGFSRGHHWISLDLLLSGVAKTYREAHALMNKRLGRFVEEDAS